MFRSNSLKIHTFISALTFYGRFNRRAPVNHLNI